MERYIQLEDEKKQKLMKFLERKETLQKVYKGNKFLMKFDKFIKKVDEEGNEKSPERVLTE